MYSRTELALGNKGVEKLKNAKVAVFGLGGVGGHCAEGLVRAGIGSIALIDGDTIAPSNLNRQLFALSTNIGSNKVDAAKAHLLAINPELKVETYNLFYGKENSNLIDLSQFDYVIDAIDTVSSKVEIIVKCKELNVPVISSMGAGNKLDPTRFEVADIYKTSVCPLAKIMRKLLKENDIKSLKVVYSKEEPIVLNSAISNENSKNRAIGSLSFVPSVVGLIIAGEVIKDIALK